MKLYLYAIALLSSFLLSAADHTISFIIPCYNCATTVKESIQSIYQQDLPYPFEVICTNDGSTDTTLQILNECQQKYPHFYVYNHEHNQGGGATRNTCVRHTMGDLIFCLDSDNVLCPRSIIKLINLIDETGCDVASFEYGHAFRTNGVAEFSFIYSVPGNHFDLYAWAKYFSRSPANGGNYLFTRKSYDRAGGYPENVGAADTFGFGLAQLATGSVMKTVPGSYYWHRLHNDSYYMREAKNNNNTHCKVLKNYSELFDAEAQKILAEKSSDDIWTDFEKYRKCKLASESILQCLFKAYSHSYEHRYDLAAQEFKNAIKNGCHSPKIVALAEEMERKSLKA